MITTTTTTTTTTTSQYGLGGAQYCSGSIMGITHDIMPLMSHILQNLIEKVL